MSYRSFSASVLGCVGGLFVGYYLGAFGSVPVEAQNAVPAKVPAGLTNDNRLSANLWVQTSAEYQAVCTQTYRSATFRLEQLVAANRPPLPAVVFDLDETVFDNSAFQSALYAAGKSYEQGLWDQYEEKFPGEVRAVPGAIEFIARAEKLGVKCIYISNRSEKYRESNIAALKHLGINTQGIEERLFLKTTSSEKAARREAVAAHFNVLMLMGDNLRDFSESFTAPKLPAGANAAAYIAASDERNQLADKAAVHWGIDWFVLPNPVYGEWEKLATPNPIDVLRPTKIQFE